MLSKCCPCSPATHCTSITPGGTGPAAPSSWGDCGRAVGGDLCTSPSCASGTILTRQTHPGSEYRRDLFEKRMFGASRMGGAWAKGSTCNNSIKLRLPSRAAAESAASSAARCDAFDRCDHTAGPPLCHSYQRTAELPGAPEGSANPRQVHSRDSSRVLGAPAAQPLALTAPTHDADELPASPRPAAGPAAPQRPSNHRALCAACCWWASCWACRAPWRPPSKRVSARGAGPPAGTGAPPRQTAVPAARRCRALPAAGPSLPSPAAYGVCPKYRVKEGDTLWNIAQKVGTDVGE